MPCYPRELSGTFISRPLWTPWLVRKAQTCSCNGENGINKGFDQEFLVTLSRRVEFLGDEQLCSYHLWLAVYTDIGTGTRTRGVDPPEVLVGVKEDAIKDENVLAKLYEIKWKWRESRAGEGSYEILVSEERCGATIKYTEWRVHCLTLYLISKAEFLSLEIVES